MSELRSQRSIFAGVNHQQLEQREAESTKLQELSNIVSIFRNCNRSEKPFGDLVNQQCTRLFVLPEYGSESRLRVPSGIPQEQQFKLVWSVESEESLTPCVTSACGQTAKTQGKRQQAVFAPSARTSLTPGLSRGCAPRLRGSPCFFCTCGISSLATLAPVFLGICLYREHQLKSKARVKQGVQESAGGLRQSCKLNQHQTEVPSWPAASYRLLIDTGDG